MRCSLNEVEGAARRAARGAGLAWGLADEAGKATRWLAARDLPGVTALDAMLARLAGRTYEEVRPHTGSAEWHAAGGELCPVCTGAALSDSAARVMEAVPLRLGPTASPLLLLPFLAQVAVRRGGGFDLRWEGVELGVDASGVSVRTTNPGGVARDAAPTVQIARNRAVSVRASAAAERVEVDEAAWQRLAALARKTYVPASEESRTGAGAGGSDND